MSAPVIRVTMALFVLNHSLAIFCQTLTDARASLATPAVGASTILWHNILNFVV